MVKGRPTIYSDELAKQICTHLREGKSLRSFCQMDNTPHLSTVYDWLQHNEVFSELYQRARFDQAQTLFDECIDIADDASNDWTEKTLRNGDTADVVNHEVVNRSKLRIETRQRMAALMAPKKYHDKFAGTEDGKPTGADNITAVKMIIVDGSTDNSN